MKTWTEIIRENEEAIMKAFREAYRDACGSQSNSGFAEVVDITRDGKISAYTQGDNSVAMDVWKGEALELHRFKWWNPVDSMDGYGAVEFLKNENKFDKFVAWLVQEEYVDAEDAEDDAITEIWRLKEWNSDLYDQYLKEVIDYTMEDFDPDIYFEQALEKAAMVDVYEDYDAR